MEDEVQYLEPQIFETVDQSRKRSKEVSIAQELDVISSSIRSEIMFVNSNRKDVAPRKRKNRSIARMDYSISRIIDKALQNE